MATFYSGWSGNHRLRLEVWVESQNWNNNSSNVRSQLWLERRNSSYFSARANGDHVLDNGVRWSLSNTSINSSNYNLISDATTTVYHDGNGYHGDVGASAYLSTVNQGYFWSVSLGVSGSVGLARIPKRPSEPGTPWYTDVGPTSVAVHWGGSGSDGGNGINWYLLRYWPNESGSGNYVDVFQGMATDYLVTGLTPGQKYRFVVYAHNSSADNGGYSNASGASVVQMLAGARIRVDGSWKMAVAYVKVNGSWKLAQPWIKVSGSWKQAQ